LLLTTFRMDISGWRRGVEEVEEEEVVVVERR
jgi:hypothetical protein